MKLRERATPAPGTPAEADMAAVPTAIGPHRVLTVPYLLMAQALIIVALVVAVLVGVPGWYGAVAGSLAVALVLVRVRGVSLAGWGAARLVFWAQRRRRRRHAVVWQPFDAEQPDGAPIGFLWDDTTLVSLIRVEGDVRTLTVIEPPGSVSGQSVPLRLLAGSLRQNDIVLQSIDVLSHGARLRSAGPVAATYDAVLGPLPAIAERSVWVVLRLAPLQCPDAIRARGGGWDGTLRTAATATRRVANRLTATGLDAQIATATGLDAAIAELTDGMEPGSIDERWQTCRDGRSVVQSFQVEPSMLDSEEFGSLWTVPSKSTTLCVSLRPARDDDTVNVRALAKFHSQGDARSPLPGLEQLTGRQFDALLHFLPVSTQRRQVGRWAHPRGADTLARLESPASGCGQLVGADEHGRAVAVTMFGPRVARVELCGTLHLAQQVVLRALALGARVRLRSARAASWQSMVSRIGDPDLLQIAVDGPDGRSQPDSTRQHTVEMFDGVPELPVRAGVTVMLVRSAHSEPSHSADVSLQLLDHHRNIATIRTKTHAAMITMVATDDEMRYLGASFDTSE
ncbi:type VII secretion protein EccE [soil metagenome]